MSEGPADTTERAPAVGLPLRGPEVPSSGGRLSRVPEARSGVGPSEFESEFLAPQARRMVQAPPRRQPTPGDERRRIIVFAGKPRYRTTNQTPRPTAVMIAVFAIESQKKPHRSLRASSRVAVGAGLD